MKIFDHNLITCYPDCDNAHTNMTAESVTADTSTTLEKYFVSTFKRITVYSVKHSSFNHYQLSNMFWPDRPSSDWQECKINAQFRMKTELSVICKLHTSEIQKMKSKKCLRHI